MRKNILIVVLSIITTIVLAKDRPDNLTVNQKPNVVIILSDDQGNADAGYQRSPAVVSTPAIDKLASDGIVFTNGYASAYVCAPTRAGLLTGRYQQRFGFYRASDSRQGMPKDEITLADILKKKGYRTGVFGKWHLGLTKPYYPTSRGFDEFYGFLGHGAHDYFDLMCTDKPDDFHQCIMRNEQKIDDTGYLTDNLGREACNFIQKNAKANQPFFCYLPFNAVHWPLQAPEADIQRFNTGDRNRDIYLAMLYRMDLAIGNVIQTLKEEKVYENTIVIFLSDNGGAKKVDANNLPLRDYKQSVYEGGLRVPFIISWPERFDPAVNNEPVISIDIMPTICAALGIQLPHDRIYDGKNILPVMEGRLDTPLHNELFFDGNDKRWAVRQGDWKLVSVKGETELYNLKEDISEQNNLADKNPEKVSGLKNKYENWRRKMAPPMGDSKK